MARRYDRNPLPHRTFAHGDRGKDVLAAQKAANLRLKRKGALSRCAEDGEWGPISQKVWTRAATLIGLPHNKPTPGCQVLMRNPSRRTAEMKERSRRAVARWKEKRAAGTTGDRVVAAANRMVGKRETGNNDAPWLRAIENALPHNRLDWMIPGNPYCGLGCIYAWWVGVRALLPDGAVYTPNICGWAGRTIRTAPGAKAVRFRRVAPEHAKPGALVVMNFGSGGAKHVALARGPMRNGSIATTEFNTSPGSGGSQANGGGVWKRTRPRGFILCVLNIDVV